MKKYVFLSRFSLVLGKRAKKTCGFNRRFWGPKLAVTLGNVWGGGTTFRLLLIWIWVWIGSGWVVVKLLGG